MRIVDTLVGLGERSAEVSVTISDEMPFVSEDGTVDEVAYFEMFAQSIAAMNGFKNMEGPESSAEGYLVGAQDLEVLGTAHVGDTLNISVFKESRFGKFGVIRGTVSRNDAVLARGAIKVWHDTEDVGGHANPPE
jgi:predicted hotdog family 3-hydroxylacyl-ACP dehydratase